MRFIFYFILGSCLASFHMCQADRMVRCERWWKGRSHCDGCGRQLSWWELIPIGSFLYKRTCKTCGRRIGFRYAAAELGMGLLCGALSFRYRENVICMLLCILFGQLLTVGFVDKQLYLIPSYSLWICVLVWIAISIYRLWDGAGMESVVLEILSACSMYIVMSFLRIISRWIRQIECIGYGDVLLYTTCSLFIPGLKSVYGVWLSSAIGLVSFLIHRQRRIAFGPCIVIACIFLLFL